MNNDSLANSRVVSKRQFAPVKGLNNDARLIAAPNAGDLPKIQAVPGDMMILKLDFTPEEITAGRVVVVRVQNVGRLTVEFNPPDEEGLVRLGTLHPQKEDYYFDAEDVRVEAVLLRVDPVMWEYQPEAARLPQSGGKPRRRAKRPQLYVVK